jgi:HlyD family secretion protein
MKKKILIIGIPLIVLGAVGAYIFGSSGSNDVTFRVEKVTRGDISIVVTATGTVFADTTVAVGTQVSGIVSKIYVDFNSVVKKGQVLATIDTTVLSAQVQQAEANLDRVTAQFNDAKRSLDRTKALFEKSLSSQSDYDVALTAYETNLAQKKQAQGQVNSARLNLGYSTIRAPISGVVIDRKVDLGQTVAASFSTPTLFSIANNLSKMQVQTNVDEADIGKIRVGQKVTFSVDSYPDDRFAGKVKQIRLASVTVQNVVNYTVIIEVPNPELKLMPGMTATVTILIAKKESVLRVPSTALRFQPSADLIVKKETPDSSKMAIMQTQVGQQGQVDSSKKGEQKKAEQKGQPATADQRVQGGAEGGRQGFTNASPEERQRMMQQFQQRMQNASPEERQRMTERFQRMREQGGASSSPVDGNASSKQAQASYPSGESFKGIGTSPLSIDMRGRGRVWVQNKQNKLEAVRIVTGLSDGTFTEVEGMQEGQEIVIGASGGKTTSVQTSPLGGQQQGGRPMMRF